MVHRLSHTCGDLAALRPRREEVRAEVQARDGVARVRQLHLAVRSLPQAGCVRTPSTGKGFKRRKILHATC